MIKIEYQKNLDKELYEVIDNGFNQYALKNEVVCDYQSFAFVAKEEDKLLGVITGNAYYQEVHIRDLIVMDEFRHQHIGTQLVQTVEKYFKNKGYKNINLTTYAFQAPDFYQKCGFEVEFIRKNTDNPKLDKYYFVKYFQKSF